MKWYVFLCKILLKLLASTKRGGATMDIKDADFTIPDYMQALLTASGQGLEALARTLADLLSLPVVVCTSAYELIAAPFFDHAFDSLNVTTDNPKENHAALFSCTITTDKIQTKATGRAIAPAGRVIGYIFVLLEDARPESEHYQVLMDYAASLCVIHLQNRLELKQVRYQYKNTFLYDLLYGNLKRNEEIIVTGDTLGWNFRLPHTAFVFCLPELEHYSPDRHLIDILRHLVERALIYRYHGNPATIVRQNWLITILPTEIAKPAVRKKEILDLMDTILTQAADCELKNRLVCGVGQTYDEATDIFRSCQEAKVACEIGALMDVAVPFFSDMGLERILYKHDLQDLKEYYEHVLGELCRQDDAESSLIGTLESLAFNQFDMNKTAQALFLHRNTLRYRLNKIENILGQTLNDNNTRQDILAAFKIKRLHAADLDF